MLRSKTQRMMSPGLAGHGSDEPGNPARQRMMELLALEEQRQRRN